MKAKETFKFGTILIKAESVNLQFKDFVKTVKKFDKEDRYKTEIKDITEALDSTLRKARKDREEVKEE